MRAGVSACVPRALSAARRVARYGPARGVHQVRGGDGGRRCGRCGRVGPARSGSAGGQHSGRRPPHDRAGARAATAVRAQQPARRQLPLAGQETVARSRRHYGMDRCGRTAQVVAHPQLVLAASAQRAARRAHGPRARRQPLVPGGRPGVPARAHGHRHEAVSAVAGGRGAAAAPGGVARGRLVRASRAGAGGGPARRRLLPAVLPRHPQGLPGAVPAPPATLPPPVPRAAAPPAGRRGRGGGAGGGAGGGGGSRRPLLALVLQQRQRRRRRLRAAALARAPHVALVARQPQRSDRAVTVVDQTDDDRRRMSNLAYERPLTEMVSLE